MSDPSSRPARQVGTAQSAARAAVRPARPVHLGWANIGLVALGGAVGTGTRYLIIMAIPPWAGVPMATLGINVLGAFVLGALLERLADRGLDTGRSRRIRLLAGTGFLGGFTTYSALATDTATLLTTHAWRGIGYALGTVVLGAVASVAGIALARRLLGPATPQPAER
jgi:CrcB protein